MNRINVKNFKNNTMKPKLNTTNFLHSWNRFVNVIPKLFVKCVFLGIDDHCRKEYPASYRWCEPMDRSIISIWINEIDNTWCMKSFLTKKQGISSKEADQALEIPEDFDYVELPDYLKTNA